MRALVCLILAAWSWHLPYSPRIGGQQFSPSAAIVAGTTTVTCGPFNPPVRAAIIRMKISGGGSLNWKTLELRDDAGDLLADFALSATLTGLAQLTRMVFSDVPMTTITLNLLIVGAPSGTLDMECTGGANGLPGQQS